MFSDENEAIPCYELIVVGLGLLGASTLYEAAIINQHRDLKSKILGIEQYALLHGHGSSHGESRITRQAIGEGADYVSLAIKSQEKLIALQTQTKGKFGQLHYDETSGVLVIGSDEVDSEFHGMPGFLQNTRKIATKYHIPHINFDSQSALQARFPQFNFKMNNQAYLEQTIGLMNPDACVYALIQLAMAADARVQTEETVLHFQKLAHGKIAVITNKGRYLTNKLILTVGAWLPQFVNETIQSKLSIYRQSVFYFEVDEAYQAAYRLPHFHPFIWDLGHKQCVYGFPILSNDGSAIKIGTEIYLQATTAQLVNRKVSADEIDAMYAQYIKPHFKGILPKCQQAFVCLYTKTPDSQFLIDYLPHYEKQILYASACSGHGAKHAFALGHALAQEILLGKNDENILKFNLQTMEARFHPAFIASDAMHLHTKNPC